MAGSQQAMRATASRLTSDLTRGENYVPPPPQKGIALDEKVLSSYVGTYDLGPVSFVVGRVGKALTAQRNGQGRSMNCLRSPRLASFCAEAT